MICIIHGWNIYKWKTLYQVYYGVKTVVGGFTGLTSQCFVAGTKVKTENGDKPIEEIKEGDKVWSFNPDIGEEGLKEVKQTFIIETEEKKEQLEELVKVYNFEVEDWHTYCVSEYGVIVHNLCDGETVDSGSGTNVGGSGTKDIYRAVGVEEYYDIMDTGRFRGVDGSLVAKEFGNDFNETLDLLIGLSIEIKLQLLRWLFQKMYIINWIIWILMHRFLNRKHQLLNPICWNILIIEFWI